MPPDQLDDALSVFAATAPQFGRLGLSNHGPMASEVLEHMDRADAIAPWVEQYRQRLSPAPAPAEKPMSEGDWPDALGDLGRYPEWLAFFEIEIADRPVAAVVGEWVPRLIPGLVGAATHGLIRTAHGLRALSRHDSAPRRLEVATGLAYWASVYQELPGPPLLIGHQGVAAALADLPYLPEEVPEEPLITAQLAHINEIADEFEQAVASLGFSGEGLELLDQLAIGGARAYLQNAEGGHPVALIHAVTAPLALELALPWLAGEDRDAALGYAWQAVAALHVAYAIDRRLPDGESRAVATPAELVDLALASGDEHALKLTEAALRCHARTGEDDLLRAAAEAAARLGG